MLEVVEDGWDAVSLVLGVRSNARMPFGQGVRAHPGGCVGGERMCVLEALGSSSHEKKIVVWSWVAGKP